MIKWFFLTLAVITFVPLFLVNFSELLTARLVVLLCMVLMYVWGFFHGVWRNV